MKCLGELLGSTDTYIAMSWIRFFSKHGCYLFD